MPLLLSPASSPTPSPAILDFLARLSLPLPPNSPPAPSFLCPSCQRPELSSARRRRRQLPTPSSPNPAAAPFDHQQAQHLPEQVYHYNRFKTSYNKHDSSLAFVPPKYVQDSDGFWYPATSWSLHGETSKPSLLSFPTATPPSTSLPFLPSNVVTATPSIQLDDPLLGDGDDDDSDFTASGSSSSPGASIVASDYDAIKNSLPTGWTLPPHRTEFYSTRVIVIVSLILAISLSLIIAGCVLGHKAKSGSHRQSFRKILNEAKSRANAQKSLSRTSSPPPLNVEVDTESGDPELEAISDSEKAEMISKHMKKREKLWDKWRNKSGKLSDFGLRRRKKKNASINNPSVTKTIPASPSTLAITTPPVRIVHQGASPLTSPPGSSALPVVSSTSTSSGQVGSFPSQSLSSLRPSSPALNASHSLQTSSSSSSAPSLTIADADISLVSSAQLTPSSRQPPAYRHGAAAAASDHEMSRSPSHVIQNQSRELVDINTSPCPSRQSLEEYPHPEYSPPPLLSSSTTAGSPGLLHRGHLATDNKAVLELMRKGASEPLRNEDGHALTSISSTSPQQLEAAHPSAPVWIDESLEHFEELQDSKDRDRDQDHYGSETTSPSPPRSNLRLPPLPSADFHLRLERHYNMEALLPLSETESSTEAISLNGSEPSSLLDLNPSSSSILRPSAPPHDDEEDDLSVSYQLRPSAPPLLSEFEGNNSADGDEENSVDTDVEQREDERQSRWNRQVDLEASLARTRSTPGTAPLLPSSSSPRPHRRRSLSISSLANGSLNSNKRLSLPRYEP